LRLAGIEQNRVSTADAVIASGAKQSSDGDASRIDRRSGKSGRGRNSHRHGIWVASLRSQ
jgi:hypothetical protein